MPPEPPHDVNFSLVTFFYKPSVRTFVKSKVFQAVLGAYQGAAAPRLAGIAEMAAATLLAVCERSQEGRLPLN